MLNISQLSTKYRIKKMEEEDISRILNIENGNPQYFAYCPPKPCRETVLNDLKAIPEGKSEDKISEEIMDCFQCMKEFYHHILEANGNILITIC